MRRRKEGIDWFEIRPEIRCNSRLLGARDMKRILKGASIEDLTLAEAARLLADRREAGPPQKKRTGVRKPAA